MTHKILRLSQSLFVISVLAFPLICMAEPPSKDQLSSLYRALCVNCHGAKGDGNGAVGRFLLPLPRDFSARQFKLVSTDNKQPSDEDLDRVIRNGMPGTGMPGFGALTIAERRLLVRDVRMLAFTQPSASVDGRPIIIQPPDPRARPELMSRGRELYGQHCAVCHGASGAGDGPAAMALQDVRGDPNRPRNFLQEPLRGGSDQEAIFARIRNGMPGSAMPASTLPDNDIWAIVFHLRTTYLVSHAPSGHLK